MNAFYSLFLVFALIVVALLGAGAAHLSGLFGIIIPYVAVAVFVLGFAWRVYCWAKSPVPFRIPTSAGQQWSLDWIKGNSIDNPHTVRATVIRMFFEVCCFRSLFRNTKAGLKKAADGETVVTYSSEKLLWLGAILFHYSFLVIVVRHMRLFTEPIPAFVTWTDFFDGILQIGVPTLYMTDILILAGLGYLLWRRVVQPQIRYLSNAADFFALYLIIAIALSGIYMRYFAKVDVVAIKEFTMSLVMFSPHVPENIAPSFWVHLFLVSVLLIYFPFSKLMHLGGVFLSPTRNLPNDSRIKHHENPWNPKAKWHTYEAYEDDFREPMYEAGLPLEKKPENAEND